MKAILIDAGNTRFKWGVVEDGDFTDTGHVSQASIREHGLGVLTAHLPRHVDAVMASNVAGATFQTRLTGLIGAHCDVEPRFAKSESQGFGVINAYKAPRNMGVDRWVAMVGARAEFGKACLVVDAGTAVTIDALDDDGRHVGGQILPGVELMAKALASETSDIPMTDPSEPGEFEGLKLFAADTAHAVASGSESAVTGAVERAYRVLRSSAKDAELILTGGDASRILGALDEPAEHRPNLVLSGLWRMLENEAS